MNRPQLARLRKALNIMTRLPLNMHLLRTACVLPVHLQAVYALMVLPLVLV